MNNYFVIASHSTYAQGIYNCLKFFKNDIDNVFYINAYVEDNDFVEKFDECLEKLKGKNVIVLTDLPGGSVNQLCNSKLHDYNFHLISGVNFPLALELVFQEEKLDASILRQIIEDSKQQIVYMNDLVSESQSDEDDEL